MGNINCALVPYLVFGFLLLFYKSAKNSGISKKHLLQFASKMYNIEYGNPQAKHKVYLKQDSYLDRELYFSLDSILCECEGS